MILRTPLWALKKPWKNVAIAPNLNAIRGIASASNKTSTAIRCAVEIAGIKENLNS